MEIAKAMTDGTHYILCRVYQATGLTPIIKKFRDPLSLMGSSQMRLALDTVLRQLTAFANREGEILLFGIRDDGTYEGASFDPNEEVSRILNWARDRISPNVDFEPREYRSPEGTVIYLKVSRRSGAPIAVVRRALHEIDSRRLYIRTANGVRTVDDRTLEW